MLNCLEALGYVDRSGADFRFNKRGKKNLAQDSPESFRHFILFGDILFESLSSLEETIRKGEPAVNHLETYGEREWEIYSRGMNDISRHMIPEILKKAKLPAGAKRLLDLGGSHGQHSVAMCKKYDGLKATVVDYAAVQNYANETIAGTACRTAWISWPCDFMEEAIPGNADAVLLFNIVHSYTPERNTALFEKIYDAMNPGGRLLILEQLDISGGRSQFARAMVSYMAINLFHQANGNTYPYEEISSWAKKAGFSATKLTKLNVPGVGIITCTK